MGKKADVMKVQYIFNEAAKREKAGKTKKGEGETTPTYQESLFTYKTNWLGKADPTSEESTKLFEELIGQEDLADMKMTQAHAARLQSMELDSKLSMEKATAEKAEEVLKVADKVLERVSASEILAFFAVKNADLRPDGGDTDGGDKAKKDMEKKKGWYLEAMAKKGLALCVLDRLEEANKCLLYLLQFVDQSDSKAVFFATVHAERVGHYGRALKLIQHQLEEKPGSSDLDNRQSHLYDKLGWDHAAKMARMSKPLRFPTAYDMF